MYEVRELEAGRAVDAVVAGPEASARAGSAIDLGRLWVAVRRGKWWLLLAVVGGGAAAYPVAQFLAPPRYLATASIVWEQPPSGEGLETARELRTMVDSVELPTNLGIVKARLGLPETVDEIGAAIEVTYEDESNLLNVSSRARDPNLAAALSNTTADVFLESRRAAEIARRTELSRALAADLDRARVELDRARGDYDRFRAEQGIADLSLETQQAIELAASLRAQADLARTEMQAADSRVRTLRSETSRVSPATVTEITAPPPEVTPEQRRLVEARERLAEARTRLADAHPTVQALVAEVDAWQARAALATRPTPYPEPNEVVRPNPEYQALRGNIAGSVARREVLRERERRYQELAAAAEERLRSLSAVEGRASALLAAQRVAEQHVVELEAVRLRAVDEARAPSTGLRVVAPATRPEGPEPKSRKKTIVVMAALPIVALVLALFALLAGSIARLKAWTAAEVAYWGRAPVVGSSTWPRETQALAGLLEELDEFTSKATGRTLVLSVSKHAQELAAAVAFSLTRVSPAAAGPRVGAAPIRESEDTGVRRAPAWPKAWSRSAVLGRLPAPSHATALELVPAVEHVAVPVPVEPFAPAFPAWEAWQGPEEGPLLRRAARQADRVLVVVPAGTPLAVVAAVRSRLGRTEGIAFLLVGLRREHTRLPDRSGAVASFWAAAA